MLAYKSPVFKKMLSEICVDGQMQEVPLTDTNFDEFMAFLKIIYMQAAVTS